MRFDIFILFGNHFGSLHYCARDVLVLVASVKIILRVICKILEEPSWH